MSKRKRQKGPRRSYLKRWSAEVINTGKGPNKEMVADYHSRMKSKVNGLAIPATITTLNDMIADSLHYKTHPLMEKREAKKRLEEGKPPWHELMLKPETEVYKLCLCYAGECAIFVEVYKAVKTVATTPPYSSVKKALAVYSMLGPRRLPWGFHRSYNVGA